MPDGIVDKMDDGLMESRTSTAKNGHTIVNSIEQVTTPKYGAEPSIQIEYSDKTAHSSSSIKILTDKGQAIETIGSIPQSPVAIDDETSSAVFYAMQRSTEKGFVIPEDQQKLDHLRQTITTAIKDGNISAAEKEKIINEAQHIELLPTPSQHVSHSVKHHHKS